VTDTPPPDRTLEQRRLLLDQVEGRLKVQSEELDGLDRKATTILGATGVVLGLVISNASDFATSPCPVPYLFYGALVVLAAGLVAGVWTLWPRSFQVVPEPGPFLAEHQSKTPEHTIGELVKTKADVFVFNKKVVETKADRIRLQMVLLALGGILLVGAYVMERLV
jgi:hypothetical protein